MTRQIEVEVLDPVFSKVLEGKNLLQPCLSYVGESYTQGQYRKIRKEKRKSLISRGGLFHTGFIPRIQAYCDKNDIDFVYLDVNSVLSSVSLCSPAKEPELDGVDIKAGKWSYQYDLIQKAIQYRRGIIKAATASGKTIMMAGLISAFPDAKVLFLSNSYTPISQFKETIEDVNLIHRNITVSTIQSFVKKNPKDYVDAFDMILIDEAHEGLSSKDTMYAKVLQNSLAGMRIGFTATLPDNESARLSMEGLLGPVIGELTIQEGTERGVLAKPKIVLKMLPENSSLHDYRQYAEVYKFGVVRNRALNRQVVKDAIDYMQPNKVVLILVLEIEHGYNIVEMAKTLYDEDFVFVQGGTEVEVRDRVRYEMKEGGPKVVVATAVFRKALNVPGLDAVLDACGGKSESQTLQIIGRGLRATNEKDQVIICDYFNPNHHFLIKHFGYRLCIYFREGWM